MIIVARELLVTALRSFIENAGGDFSAKMAGKLKMWFQCIAVVACLWALAETGTMPTEDNPVAEWLHWTIVVSVWVAVLSTLYSGYEYVVVAAKTIDLGGHEVVISASLASAVALRGRLNGTASNRAHS